MCSVVHCHARSCLLYLRGPRSGLGYIVPVHPHLIGLMRPTHGHTAISPQCGLYAMPSLCGAPRRPLSGSVLSLASSIDMSSSATTGSSSAACTQFLHRQRWPSTTSDISALPKVPTLRFSWGGGSRGLPTVCFRYNLFDLLALLSELTGVSPSRQGLLLPGFRRIGHPLRRRI